MQSDHELVNGCRKNNLTHQEALYKKYYAFGMSVCLRYAQNREDALEILNDSFMKVFKNIHQFDLDRPFKTWFRRIMINTAVDHNRKKLKSIHIAQVELDEESAIVPSDIELNMNVDDILLLFNKLPDMHRMIFNLYEIEGYSHEEIAGMLDIAPGTSRSHLSRAKKSLALLYDNHIARRDA